MNDRSPGYEPDGMSWLPYLAMGFPIGVSYLTALMKSRPSTSGGVPVRMVLPFVVQICASASAVQVTVRAVGPCTVKGTSSGT